MPRIKPAFTEVTETLKSDEGLSARDTALFHYLNPNGLYAQKVASDQKIHEAVYTHGTMKTGAIFAHGTMNHDAADQLANEATKARPRRKDVLAACRRLRAQITRASEAIRDTAM